LGAVFGEALSAGLAAGDAACFLSVSTEAAGDAAFAGATAGVGVVVGVGVGDATGNVSDCRTEREPLIPGSDRVSAINIKAIAAPIVIFARMFCVPRGPKAVLETLLVNKAPASALPGCSSITTIRTAQDKINNAYRV